MSGFASERPVEYITTREGYDRWAAIYDLEENPVILLEEQHLAPLLGDVRDLAVADLGCGTGRHAIRLAAAGARVTALDFSDGMVAKARGKAGWERVEFIAHDLSERLPLPDRSFDCVLSCLVLDHISDIAAFFSECRRVCRDGGFVLVSVFHPALTVHGIHARFVDPITGGRERCRARPGYFFFLCGRGGVSPCFRSF